MTERPAKTQISLGIRPVWSVSLLCAQRVAKDPSIHADSEDSDQTGQMPRLIWVFTGRTTTLLVLSCGGSYWWYIAYLNSNCFSLGFSLSLSLVFWNCFWYSSFSWVHSFSRFRTTGLGTEIRRKKLERINDQHSVNHYMSQLLTKPTKWLCAQRRLRSAWASAGGCPGWSKSLLGAHATLLVLSRGGSYVCAF